MKIKNEMSMENIIKKTKFISFLNISAKYFKGLVKNYIKQFDHQKLTT